MDKETINNYLMGIREFMKEGKFIRAYSELNFVIDNLKVEAQGK